MDTRAAWKKDVQSTAAEMVFGEPIRLPGQFLHQQTVPGHESDDYVGRLRKIMSSLKPQVKRHGLTSTFVFKDLETTPYVFVRHDVSTGGSLQPPYDEPYEVLNKAQKTFKLRIRGRPTNVTVDRLKPAYIMPEEQTEQKKAEHNQHWRNKLVQEEYRGQ